MLFHLRIAFLKPFSPLADLVEDNVSHNYPSTGRGMLRFMKIYIRTDIETHASQDF